MQTIPAIVQNGPFQGPALNHPALAFYHKLQTQYATDPNIVLQSLSSYYTPDWTFIDPSGNILTSIHQFFADFIQPMVSKFARYAHQTNWFIVYEIGDKEWEVVEGTTNLFGFEGSDVDGEFVDAKGLKWSFGIPAVYKFVFVDDGSGEGVRMKRQETIMNSSIIEQKVLERQGTKMK